MILTRFENLEVALDSDDGLQFGLLYLLKGASGFETSPSTLCFLRRYLLSLSANIIFKLIHLIDDILLVWIKPHYFGF